MFHRFTRHYYQALDFARQEAVTWNHGYLGCEHLLIGLLKVTDSVAVSVLSLVDINETKARAICSELVCPGKEPVVKRRLPRTRRATRALKPYAIEEAQTLNHRIIGTEHLLLALLRDDENMAVRILVSLGLQPDQVRKTVLTHLSRGM